jgi:hypothetical protein
VKHIHTSSDLLLVCCVHGDETLGLDVFYEFYGRKDVSLLLANERAIEQNVRYTETDLNRCFPGNPNGTYEEQLAAEMLPIIQSYKTVLDIHTTTSDLIMTPIITKRNDNIDNIIRKIVFPREVALIPEPYNLHSLIHQVNCGVSLEFGEKYAQDNIDYALMMIEDIVSGNNNKNNHSVKKDLYTVCGTLTHKLAEAKNFSKVADMFYSEPLYSFLVDEKAYEKVGNHGLLCYKETGVEF